MDHSRWQPAGSLSGSTGLESQPFLVTVDLTTPTVTLAADATTFDLTPELRVVATDVNGAPTAANVIVDVDLNNDNDFGDASETGYMTATSAMTTGLAIFGARKGVRDRFQL